MKQYVGHKITIQKSETVPHQYIYDFWLQNSQHNIKIKTTKL